MRDEFPFGNPDRMPPDEAEAWSGSARSAFEGQDELPWRGDYEALLTEEWPWYDGPEWNRWRLAAYVAWSSAPIEGRWPGTLQEFAQAVGWSGPRQLRKYRRRYPDLDRFIREAVLEPLFERRAKVLQTLADMAEKPDYKAHNDRELYLKMAGLYQPSQDVNVRQTSITADDMAQAQAEATEEVDDWEDGRFGGDEDDDE